MERLFFVLLFMHLTMGSTQSRVDLSTTRLQNGNILMRCAATGQEASRSVVQLGCSFQESGICRENCSQPCLILNGKTDCSGIKQDAIVNCIYTKKSINKFEVDYEIADTGETDSYWCRFRGFSSQKFDPETKYRNKVHADKDVVLESVSGSRKLNQRSIEEHDDSSTKSTNPERFLTPEVIFIIVLCTIASCVFNVIFFIRCQMTRNYIHGLAAGGPTKPSLERCLCIKELAKTYQRGAPVFTNERSGSNEKMNRGKMMENIGGRNNLLTSLTEPRRTPLQLRATNNGDGGFLQFPYNHLVNNQSTFHGSRQMLEDMIYDDVHQSTACPTELNVNDSQDVNFCGMAQTPQSARKCIVDQGGTVYVAMGQVLPDGGGISLGSKATLTSTGEPQTPRSPRQWRGSQNRLIQRSPGPPVQFQGGRSWSGHSTPARIRVNSGMPPIFPSNGNNMMAANYSPRMIVKNQELKSLPEEEARGFPRRNMNFAPSSHISSSLSAPMPFADGKYVEDNDMDDEDPFEMAGNTLLPLKRSQAPDDDVNTRNWDE